MSKGYVWSGAFRGIMTSFGIFYKNLKLVPFAPLIVSMLTCKSRIVPEINSCSLKHLFWIFCSRRERKIKAANVGPQAALGRTTAARLAQLEERRELKSQPEHIEGFKNWWDHANCDENCFLVQVIASFVGGDVEPLGLLPSFLHISLPRTLARSSGFLIPRGWSYFSSWQRIMGLVVYPSQRSLRQSLTSVWSIARYSLIAYSGVLRNE